MKTKTILMALVFLCLLSLNFASASIENIPVNISYDSGTNQLSVYGENLYWQKVFDNNSFSVTLNIIRNSEVSITDLQSSLSNMTAMCNSSMNYLNPLIDCTSNLSRLGMIELAYNNTVATLSTCQNERDNYKTRADQVDVAISNQKTAESQRWLFGIGGAITGCLVLWWFKIRKKETKNYEEDTDFSPTGR